MSTDYAIKVYKQYFNFAASHFMIFKDGTREPLHGHNYRVMLKGQAPHLNGDMVFDFLDIKPIVREVCDELDHKFLLPTENPQLKWVINNQNLEMTTPDGAFFSFPEVDSIKLPLTNISAERLAIFLAKEINKRVHQRFQFHFTELEIEVEETPGQSAVYVLRSAP